MLKIIGTTHLDSKESIEAIIKDFNPDVIGVELCETRFKVFTNQIQQAKEKDETLMGRIADETKKKAQEEGLDYGSDQKAAMFYAINNHMPLLLVDKDIMKIREDMGKIPKEEMIYLQKELIKFQTEKIKTEVNEEEVINNMKKDIPTVFKILVEDRNNVIESNIRNGINKYKDKKILVFLGKGHAKEIQRRFN